MQIKQKALFLDRDGTLIEDRGFITDEKQVVFLPGVFETLRKLQKRFLLFIVTNQNSEHVTDIRVSEINRYIHRCMAEEGIIIQEIYACNHPKTAQCRCRKPSTYFLEEATDEYHIDLQQSFVIGDHPSDIQLALNAGACGIYVLTGHGRKHRNEIPAGTFVVADITRVFQIMISDQARIVIDNCNSRGGCYE
jgi:D-glycero-D-manno-heptose 1,7-bisphosphate phosphatase